ncbi:MAG: hypothetical protein M0Z89_11055 [Nitrospiraceae bacterium]|nr:hypothetical protein [Nitrospiraceae bacterium]
MPSVNKNLIMVLLLIVGLLALAGCGSEKNDKAVFDGDQHPAGWLPAGHMAAAKTDVTVCAECHGSDYAGGISGVSCTLCHLGGVDSVHPAAWSQNTGTYHAPYAASNGTTACSNMYCHGNGLTGVAGSGPSCTSCHLGGPVAVHPSAWSQNTGTFHAPYAVANGTTACSNVNCHGTTLTGVGGSGPSCTSCHLGSSTSVHPIDWAGSILTKHGLYVVANSTGACANINCHGGHLEGVAGSGPSCSSCHSFP